MLELFSGTGVMTLCFREQGFDTYTIDNNQDHAPDLCTDIQELTSTEIIQLFGKPTIIWASPPCTTFSTLSISKHWRGNEPLTELCRRNIELVRYTLQLIKELDPFWWFIENPRGKLRNLEIMKPLERYRNTVTYCQYGLKIMKPTDIWTNLPIGFKPPCNYGDPCHTELTDEIEGSIEKAKLPPDLCHHVAKICRFALDHLHPVAAQGQ